MDKRNRWLLLVLCASVLPLLWSLAERRDASLALLLGKTVGQCGILLLVWQMLLGFRGVIGRAVPDWLWVSHLHRRIATVGVVFVAAHPILMMAENEDWWLWMPAIGDEVEVYLTLGRVAFALMLLAWIMSALIRERLGFRLWKRLHFLNYLVAPFAFLHSLNVGSTFEDAGWLRTYWYLLAAVSGSLMAYRLLYQAGVGQARHVVSAVTPVTHDTTTLRFKPCARGLEPKPGQFVYVQTRRFGESHPYTVSHYDALSGEISITAKRLGRFSGALQQLQTGQVAYLDGPYGVFTREALSADRPVVLVAGGIGITPFLRLLSSLRARPESERPQVILLYGNKTEQDIVFRMELAAIESAARNVRVVHVLSQAAQACGPGMEIGRIDPVLFQKYLPGPVPDCEFFLCGPPPMMAGLTLLLGFMGVAPRAIHTERFAV